MELNPNWQGVVLRGFSSPPHLINDNGCNHHEYIYGQYQHWSIAHGLCDHREYSPCDVVYGLKADGIQEQRQTHVLEHRIPSHPGQVHPHPQRNRPLAAVDMGEAVAEKVYTHFAVAVDQYLEVGKAVHMVAQVAVLCQNLNIPRTMRIDVIGPAL